MLELEESVLFRAVAADGQNQYVMVTRWMFVCIFYRQFSQKSLTRDGKACIIKHVGVLFPERSPAS